MTRLPLAFMTPCAVALCALQASRRRVRAVSSGPGKPLLMATPRMARALTHSGLHAQPAHSSRQRQ